MRINVFVACLGVAGAALGVALASSAAALADAIDDAWPYDGLGSGFTPMQLPGYYDPDAQTSSGDLIFTHTYGGTDQWYSATETTSTVPNLYDGVHEQVTGLLDTSASYPSVGTTYDESELFPIYNPAFGTVNLITNVTVNDPKLGFGDQFSLPGISNTFVSDVAGIKDEIHSFGQTFTLLDIPYSVTPAAGAASDLGDGFGQLLSELPGTV